MTVSEIYLLIEKQAKLKEDAMISEKLYYCLKGVSAGIQAGFFSAE